MQSGKAQILPSPSSTTPVDENKKEMRDKKDKRMQQKALKVIENYINSLSCINLYGKKRAEQLAEKIKNTQASKSLMVNIMADFIRTGKTDCDHSVLSFFRSPSRSSGFSRESLRGMFIDNFLGKHYFAKADDTFRLPNIYSLLQNTVTSIAKRILDDWASLTSKPNVDARRAGQSLR